MKRGRLEVLTIVIVLLLVLVGFSLFDYFNNLNKEDISGGVVDTQVNINLDVISQKELELKQLTAQLNNLNSDFKSATSQTKILIKNNLAQASKQRKQLMLELIEENPKSVLDNALKQEVIDSMSDDVKENLEKRVSKQGELEVLIEDDFENKRSKIYYYLNENGKRSSLHFADQEPFELISGTKVRLSGLQIDDKIALYKSPTDEWHTLEVESVPDLKEFNQGEQKTAVILVDYLGDVTAGGNDCVHTASSEEYNEAILDPNNLLSVNSFYKEISYEKAWLTGDVFGWYLLEGPPSSDRIERRDYIIKQVDKDISFQNYKRIIFVEYMCSSLAPGPGMILGLGTVGVVTLDTEDGPIVVSVSEINAAVVIGGSPPPKNLIKHELGHNFGVGETYAYDCKNFVINIDGTDCDGVMYGSVFDVMGNPKRSEHQNAYYKELYGWLDEYDKIVVISSGKYTIYPLEVKSNNKKYLEIPLQKRINTGTICGGNNIGGWLNCMISSYLLDYRIPIGFDLNINSLVYDNYPGIILGGKVSIGYNVDPLKEYWLLDATPNSISDDFMDAILIIGETFYDPYNKISITPTRLTEDGGIEVEISFNRFYVKGGGNENVAYFDMLGNIVSKGTCQVQTNCVAPTDSFVLKNANNEVVSYIDSQGNVCIETGDCSSSTSCTATTNDEFIIQDETGKVVSKIDLTNGDLCYIGKLTENGNI